MSAVTGAGLDELRAALARRVGERPRAGRTRPARLFVDRVFTLRGIGTVVTGTLWSGAISRGRRAALHAGRRASGCACGACRSTTRRSYAERRASASRSRWRESSATPSIGATRSSHPARFPVSYRLDVTLEELEPIAHGARLLVHHGTSRVPARVVRVGDRHAQLRLAAPVVAARGDRVVLRSRDDGRRRRRARPMLHPARSRRRGLRCSSVATRRRS